MLFKPQRILNDPILTHYIKTIFKHSYIVTTEIQMTPMTTFK